MWEPVFINSCIDQGLCWAVDENPDTQDAEWPAQGHTVSVIPQQLCPGYDHNLPSYTDPFLITEARFQGNHRAAEST